MSSTIHVGAMPAALSAIAGGTSATAGSKTSGLNFLDLAAREIEKNAGQDISFVKDQMTLGQYKKYISGRISAISIDPSRALDSLSVKISDAGFQAMKDDPDYEEWVLKTLENAWSIPKGFGGSSAFETYSIGADPDSFRVSSVETSDKADELLKKLEGENDEETFWERRHRHHEEYMALAQHEAFLRKLRGGGVSSAELLLSGLI